MVQITGYCHDTGKGFKKQFFATTKDGNATKMAEQAYNFKKDDWVSLTLDDSQFKNVTEVKATTQPADFTDDMANSNSNSNSGGGYKKSYSGGGAKSGGSQMSKAEWAAKELRTQNSISRSVALQQAVALIAAIGPKKGTDHKELALDIAKEFYLYLADQSETTEPATSKPASDVQEDVPAPTDSDEIPF
jgi:hypothetical protein